MAEKELRMELDGIVRELIEIRSELKPRIDELKKIGTPVALALAGLIGMKIGFKVSRGMVSLLWRNRFVIVLLLLFTFIRWNQVKTPKTQNPG